LEGCSFHQTATAISSKTADKTTLIVALDFMLNLRADIGLTILNGFSTTCDDVVLRRGWIRINQHWASSPSRWFLVKIAIRATATRSFPPNTIVIHSTLSFARVLASSFWNFSRCVPMHSAVLHPERRTRHRKEARRSTNFDETNALLYERQDLWQLWKEPRP
jgi:hypothetical protein